MDARRSVSYPFGIINDMPSEPVIIDHQAELSSLASADRGVGRRSMGCGCALEAELCQMAADHAAGTARWLRQVAEYDRRKVWQQWECPSMANWLVCHMGISLITARQCVQVATTLHAYPLLEAEFAAGRHSNSRVRALCRFITPAAEADLVCMARYATAAQLEGFAAGV